jgi:hypothetical protein
MKIAVLGWGSLIWKPEGLQTTGSFLNDGPTLPIEFCRTSQDGRLTLVIDGTHGAPCVTYHAQSSFDALESAIENLRIREGMATAERVGFVDFITHTETQLDDLLHQADGEPGWTSRTGGHHQSHAARWSAVAFEACFPAPFVRSTHRSSGTLDQGRLIRCARLRACAIAEVVNFLIPQLRPLCRRLPMDRRSVLNSPIAKRSRFGLCG